MTRWLSPVDRFWGRVDKTETCWLWTTPHTNGYGYIRIEGKRYTAHRVSYQWLVGEIPEGLVLDHLCRVRNCVNPDHLEPVTNRENTIRGKASALREVRTECSEGHPFAEHGRLRYKKGRTNPYYWCTLCNKARSAANYRKRKEAASNK